VSGRFIRPLREAAQTKPISLGPCQCPGTPHPDGDEAQVYTTIGWDDLVDVSSAESEGAAQRILATRAIASWNLVDEFEVDGKVEVKPVPIVEATVRLLDPKTLEPLAEEIQALYERARAPLPNGSGAGSPRLPPATGTSTRRARKTASPSR
jgi:hypothetical protein